MIAPIELRPDDHGIPFADQRGGRSLAAEFAQDFGNQNVSMTTWLKVVQRPGLRPARRDRAGGLYSAI